MWRILAIFLCFIGIASAATNRPVSIAPPIVYGPPNIKSDVVLPTVPLNVWSNTHTPYTVFRLFPDGTSKEVYPARNTSNKSWPVRPGEVFLKMKSTGQKLPDGSTADNECYWCETEFVEIDRLQYRIPLVVGPGTNMIRVASNLNQLVWADYKEVVGPTTVWLPVDAVSTRFYKVKGR